MNNELFTIKPNLKQYYGRTITKEVEFDESMLTDEEKEYIEFGIMSLDDFCISRTYCK